MVFIPCFQYFVRKKTEAVKWLKQYFPFTYIGVLYNLKFYENITITNIAINLYQTQIKLLTLFIKGFHNNF